MKGRCSAWFLMLMFMLATLLQMANAEVPPPESEDICRYFPNNTKIRDPESCNKYITCINFESHYDECKGSTPLFDKEKTTCVKTLPDESNCFIACADSVGKFVPDPKSCKGYYYCHDKDFATPGTCPPSTHFSVKHQACIYKTESKCVTEEFNFCGVVKNGVNFRDEKFCHKFFTCIKDKMVSKTCSKKYYDPIKGACVDKSTVECVGHPTPKDVCGTKKNPKYHYYADDDATCSGYFYCDKTEDGSPDLNPRWGQCPPDTFFNPKDQSCRDPLTVKCSWDRCDGRTLTFVLSGKKGCRHYLRCRNGVTKEELSCGNLFFDERSGVCTNTVIAEPACK